MLDNNSHTLLSNNSWLNKKSPLELYCNKCEGTGIEKWDGVVQPWKSDYVNWCDKCNRTGIPPIPRCELC